MLTLKRVSFTIRCYACSSAAVSKWTQTVDVMLYQGRVGKNQNVIIDGVEYIIYKTQWCTRQILSHNAGHFWKILIRWTITTFNPRSFFPQLHTDGMMDGRYTTTISSLFFCWAYTYLHSRLKSVPRTIAHFCLPSQAAILCGGLQLNPPKGNTSELAVGWLKAAGWVP